jgi:hypothetical protein
MRKINAFALGSYLILSDAVAWLHALLGAGVAVGSPIAMPIHARTSGAEVSSWEIAVVVTAGVCMCLGSLMVLKRKTLGMVLTLIPAMILTVAGNFWVGVVYMVILLILFGMPVLMYKALSQEKVVDTRVA